LITGAVVFAMFAESVRSSRLELPGGEEEDEADPGGEERASFEAAWPLVMVSASSSGSFSQLLARDLDSDDGLEAIAAVFVDVVGNNVVDEPAVETGELAGAE